MQSTGVRRGAETLSRQGIYVSRGGVTRTLRNIYLHFEGLVAEYQWHGSRMIPVASIMQYLEYRATPTP